MDFTYDDEQQALRDAVRGLLAGAYADHEARRRTVAADDGFDRTLWGRMAEMGVLGLPFSEADGGVGAGPVEIGVSQGGDHGANRVAARPRLLERLLDCLTGRTACEVPSVPIVQLADGEKDLLLVDRHMRAALDGFRHQFTVEVGQVIGQIGEDPVRSVFPRPVGGGKAPHQLVQAIPEVFEIAE